MHITCLLFCILHLISFILNPFYYFILNPFVPHSCIIYPAEQIYFISFCIKCPYFSPSSVILFIHASYSVSVSYKLSFMEREHPFVASRSTCSMNTFRPVFILIANYALRAHTMRVYIRSPL